MSNSLTPVQFYDDTIFYIEKDGELYLPLRPIVENLGIDWKNQAEKAKNTPHFNCGHITTVAQDGKAREMLCLPARKLTAFLYSINVNKVREDLKEKLLRYQHECDDVLHEYWTKGRAPAIPQDYLSALEALVESERAKQRALALVEEQKAIIDQQEIKLGDNRDWKAVAAIPWVGDYFIGTTVRILSRIGRSLSKLSRASNAEVKRIEDPRWGKVNCYHITIISDFRDMLDADQSILADIRKKQPE